MKKIFTYAIILSAALFGSAIANAQEQKAVVLDKYVTGPVDDKYTLTLEAYATGSSTHTITVESKPLDVILVLDNSSSMTGTVSIRDTTYSAVESGTRLSTGEEYIAVIDGVRYYVKGFKTTTITGYTGKNKEYTYDDDSEKTLYYKYTDGQYYKLTWGGNGNKRTLSFTTSDEKYYLNVRSLSTDEVTFRKNQTIWDGTLYQATTATQYNYRYGVTTPTSATSGSELYTGLTAPVYGTTTLLANVSELTRCTISSSSKKRIDLLKESVAQFLNILEADAQTGGDPEKHHIAITLFGGYGNTHSILSNFSTDYSVLQNKVANISTMPSGATAANYGMQDALEVKQNGGARTGTELVVVFFTDGSPNWTKESDDDTRGSTWVGAQAINNAYILKDTYHATIFSVGLFSSMPSEGSSINKLMNNVSSNYPEAQTDGSHYPSAGGEGPVPGSYYQTSDGTDLTSIFEAIAESTTAGGASVTLTADATTVVDVLTVDYDLPEGADLDDIGLYVDEVTGYDTGTKVYSWGNRTNLVPSPELIEDYLNIGEDSYIDEVTGETMTTKKLIVTGYDFSMEDTPANDTDPIRYGNWVGPRTTSDGDTETTVYKGRRLVITIPIVPTDDYAGGYDLPTNRGNSGIYAKDNTGKDHAVDFFPVPSLDFPSIGIIKIGLAKGESATYRVQRIKDPAGVDVTDVPYSVILTGDGTTKPAYIILKDIPEGTYRIAESMWGWTYGVKSVTVKTGNSVESLTGEAAATSQVLSKDQTETWPSGITERVKCVLFIFENEKGEGDPDNAEGVVQNKFADEFGKSAASVTSVTSKTQP